MAAPGAQYDTTVEWGYSRGFDARGQAGRKGGQHSAFSYQRLVAVVVLQVEVDDALAQDREGLWHTTLVQVSVAGIEADTQERGIEVVHHTSNRSGLLLFNEFVTP